jgi:WD40 repeat protein
MARRLIVLIVATLALSAHAAPPARTDLLGDPLPAGAMARIGTLRFRQPVAIISVAYAPDGKSVATGGLDGSVRVWDVATGRERWSFTRAPVIRVVASDLRTPIAYSPDGKRLATPGSDSSVILRDAATGRELLTLRGHEEVVTAIAFGPDGKTVFAMDVGLAVRAWDAATAEVRLKVAGSQSRAASFALSPDGKTMAVGGDDGVKLRDAATGKETASRSLLGNRAHSVAFSPDGKTMAVGDRNGTVHLWDSAGTGARRVLEASDARHNEPAGSLAFSPDGKTLAVSADGTRLWDVATLKRTGRARTDGEPAAFSPDGKTLALAGSSVLRFADAKTGEEAAPFAGHTSGILALALSPDGKTLVTSSPDESVRFWDPATGKETTGSRGHALAVRSLAFSPDGRRLAGAGWISSAEHAVYLWDTATGRELLRNYTHKRGASRVVFAADAKTFLTGGNYDDVVVWDGSTGKEVRRFQQPLASVFDVVPSPDGKVLAVAGDSPAPRSGLGDEPKESSQGTIRLLTFPSGRERWSVTAHGRAVWQAAFTPDGRGLVSTGYDETARVWETATGDARLHLLGQAERVGCLAVSPDGRYLALGCKDGSVRVHDLRTGKECRRFEGHRDVVEALAFSADGRLLASGSYDTTALVWDTAGLTPPPADRGAEPADLPALWADLAGDAATAYRALGRLAAAPKSAAPFLAERVRPTAVPDAKTLARLLAELDSDLFDERERATAELGRLGDLAGPALRRYLGAKPAAEGKKRAQEIVADLDRDRPPREQLRELRAVEALEWAGAEDVLRKLAEGAPEARLTREAKAALKRLP